LISNATVDEVAQFSAYLDSQDAVQGESTDAESSAAQATAPESSADPVAEGKVPPSPKALANPEVAEPEPEVPVEPEPEPEPEVAAAESEEESSIDTWTELSETFDVEPDDLLGHIQIEGRDGALVPLSEAVEFYRGTAGLDAQTKAAVAEIEGELRGSVDQQLNEMTQITQRLITHIEQDRQVDPALQEADPKEWIRQTEYARARNLAVEQSLEAMKAEADKRSKADEEAHEKWSSQQVQITYNRHPEWRESAVGQAAMQEIHAYAKGVGFTDDQISDVRDANSIEVLWAASQWNKLQSNKPAARKVLRGLPRKNLRASARNEAAPREAQDKQRVAVQDRFAKSGRIEDALSLFEEHL